jgi:DNA polymerase-3 subunit gamma/tau
MLSTAAFNALLKTLEEPPAHVKFMFATTDPEKVLPTILSRCQRFDLRRIPAALITKHLAHIAKLEKVKIDEAALHAIARGADGSMRDAESTLDQLISFCGDKIEEADVLSMFGLAAQSQILGLSKAVLAGEIQTALTQLNELAQNGKDLGRLLSDLLNHFRNLLIFQVSRGDLNLLEVSEAEVAALKEQSGLANTESLTRILEVLTDSELRLRDTASRKILLEVAMLKAIEARNAISLDSVLKQLNQLRGPGGAGVPAAPTCRVETERRREHSEGGPPAPTTVAVPQSGMSSRNKPSPAPAPASSQAFATNAPTDVGGYSDLAGLWAKLVEAVGRVSPFTRSYLVDAQPVLFEKNIFTIGFDPEFEDHLGLVDNARNHTLLQTKLAELGHANCQIKFVKTEATVGYVPAVAATLTTGAPTTLIVTPAPKPAALPATKEKAPVPFNKNDFKNDPLIQKALEIFKGQIVEVRA